MKKESKTKKNLKVRVYYFSATGNTKYGLLLLQKYLVSAGHTCELLSIENETIIDKGDCDLLGFASPVYGGYPAEIMLNFIRKSTCFNNEIPAFTVLCPCSTIGYWGSREVFANALEEKNIKVIEELGFLGNPSHPIVVGSMEQASPKLRAFFNGIGRPDSNDERSIRDFSEKLIKTYQDYSTGRKLMSLRHSPIRVWASNKMRIKEMRVGKEHPITLDQNKCTKCGFCQKSCPAKAIVLNPYPERDLSKCFNCQKCTNLCPQHAFYLKGIECIGYYKGAFDKIKELNRQKSYNYNDVNSLSNREPFMLKFLSTSVGMALLILFSKYSDRKVIKKRNSKS